MFKGIMRDFWVHAPRRTDDNDSFHDSLPYVYRCQRKITIHKRLNQNSEKKTLPRHSPWGLFFKAELDFWGFYTDLDDPEGARLDLRKLGWIWGSILHIDFLGKWGGSAKNRAEIKQQICCWVWGSIFRVKCSPKSSLAPSGSSRSV